MRRALLTVVGVLTALVLPACPPSGGAVVSAAISVPATDSRVATIDGLAVVVGEIERELRRSRGVGSALRKGEAVFGPTKLEPDYYFGDRFDTEVIALKERLQADELRAFYESVKADPTSSQASRR